MAVIYKGRFSTIMEEEADANGRKYKYAVIVGERVVSVIPVFDDGSILLERQYRPAIMQWVYEIPAGHVDKGETYAHCAKRELEEETGYKAGKLRLLYKTYESPARVKSHMRVYIATGLVKGKKALEATENITLKRVTPTAVLAMVRKNEITDMKTISAILFYNSFARDVRKHDGH